jgi:hypothetical protein
LTERKTTKTRKVPVRGYVRAALAERIKQEAQRRGESCAEVIGRALEHYYADQPEERNIAAGETA